MAVKQERIGYYGKFTPTSLDTSSADRMRALAGLGKTTADTALAIGKPIAAREGAKKGAIAAEEARSVDEAGKITYAPVKDQVFGYGADAQNQAMTSTYKSMVALDVDDKFAELGITYKDDAAGFETNATAYIKGLVGSVPEQIKLDMQNYTAQYYRQGLNAVVKAEFKKNADVLKGQFIATSDQVRMSVLNAISNGDVDLAAEIEAEHRKNLPGYVAGGATTEGAIETANIAFQNEKIKAYIYGDVNRSYINNPELSIDERKEKGKEYIASFDTIDDPRLDPEDKKAVRAELQTMFKNAYDRDKLEIVEARTASYTETLNNLTAIDAEVMDNPNLNTLEKRVEINKAELAGSISPEDAARRIRLINSTEKLNNSQTPVMEAQIVELAYNVLELTDSDDFLIGAQNLKNRMISEQANGNLNPKQAKKINNILNNLTQSRLAKSSIDIAYKLGPSKDIINNAFTGNPEFIGSAMREVFYTAEPEIQALKDLNVAEGLDPPSEAEITAIYTEKTNLAIVKVQEENRVRALNIVTANSVPPLKKKAPQGAIDMLTASPSSANIKAFEAKYGYLPKPAVMPKAPISEMEQIDKLIEEGKAVENDSSGIPASRSVTVYPTPTKKEEAAGITPEPYVMMQKNYSSAQVKKLFTKAESKKKFTKGFKLTVDKVGQEEAEIMFINYFGQEMVNALKGNN